VGVKGGETKAFHAVFPPEDLIKLSEDLSTAKRDDAIIECGYDRLLGMWRYFTLRPDKKKPNFVRVAMETLMAVAEAITKEEVILKCQINAAPGNSQNSHVISNNSANNSSNNNHSGSHSNSSSSHNSNHSGHRRTSPNNHNGGSSGNPPRPGQRPPENKGS